jgi:CshA-type fibril repeat protein
VTVPVLANDTTGDTPLPTTVQIVGTANPGESLTVPGEGTWSVHPVTGDITFTPAPGFTADPTPIQYTVRDNDGSESNPATVTIDYVQLPPVAVDDSSLGNSAGPVTLNVVNNDSDPNGDLDPSTVDLNPATSGQQTVLVVRARARGASTAAAT